MVGELRWWYEVAASQGDACCLRLHGHGGWWLLFWGMHVEGVGCPHGAWCLHLPPAELMLPPPACLPARFLPHSLLPHVTSPFLPSSASISLLTLFTVTGTVRAEQTRM